VKGVVGLMIGIIFLSSSFTLVYGQEEKVKSGLKEKKVLTINEVLKKAQENNLDLKKASLTLDNARIAYEKAKANVLQSQSKIDEKQAELNWQQAQNTFEKSKNGIEIEIISLYNNCKYLIFLLPLKKRRVELAQNNLNRVKEKVKMGTAGELEKLAAEINLEISQQQLKNTQQQLEIAQENFSLATGIENILEFNLTSQFEKSPMEESVDTYITTALEKRKEIQFARKNVEIATDRLEQLKMTDSPLLDITKTNNDLKLLRITLKLLEESIKNEVRQKYQQLESLNIQLQLLSLKLDQARRNFENANKQFQAGLITKDELSSKEVSFQESYLELQKTKGSHYIAYLNLKISVGEELNLGEEDEG